MLEGETEAKWVLAAVALLGRARQLTIKNK